MTEEEKLVLASAMSGERDEGVVSAYLRLAAEKICRRAFPYDPTVTEVPAQYAGMQVEVAVYLMNRRGSEGLIGHSENGYSDSYESGGVPESMLRGITPMCAVLGGSGNG